MESAFYDREKARAILEKIAAYETIVLHRHVSPDYDALGSVYGLREILAHRWPEKKIHIAADHGAAFELVPQFDPIPESAWEGALAIVCDCSSTNRVDDSRFQRAAYVIKIDHHQDFQPFGDLSWVDASMTACAELIVALCLEGAQDYGLTLTPEACRYLFCGLITDTNRLQYVSAEQAHRVYGVASLLLDKGNLAPQELIHRLYLTDGPEQRFIGFLKQSFTQPIPEMIYAKVDQSVLQQHSISWETARGKANSLMGIRGVLIWALFVEVPEQGKILCEFRSVGPTINELAYRHGGGGHRLACGCEARDWAHVEQLVHELCALALAYGEEARCSP